MPGEGFCQQMWRFTSAGAVCGAGEIIFQHGSVIRMGTAIDNQSGSLSCGKAAQIGEALFRDHDLHVLIDMIDMGGHRDDAGDGAGFRG